jgi:hypothetical protein
MPAEAVLEPLAVAVLAASLVGGSTLAARRWGHGVGGVLSAFPLIVGPVLLLAAERHGARFAAQAAGATLLGLVALAGFVLVYAHVSARTGWLPALLVAWTAAAALGIAAGRLEVGLLGACACAAAATAGTRAALPAPTRPVRPRDLPAWDLPLRMALTAVLILLLTAAANRFGPLAAGALSALPVLASVLAASTHRRHGRDALLELLRGTVDGMAGFAVFCAVAGLLVARSGTAPAFVLAFLAGAAVHAAVVGAHLRAPGALAGRRLAG